MSDRPSIPVTRPWLPDRDEYLKAIADIIDRHWLSNWARYATRLEEMASGVLDNPEAMVVSSADVGLMLAWRAIECPPGEVLVPSYTFCSTVNAMQWNNLTPVFVDIDPETLCMDVEHAASLVTDRTVGVCAVHTFGRPAEISAIEQLAAANGLKVVFDAAHVLGGTYDGKGHGAFGDASVFSLSGTKLVTAGEGGVVTLRDEAARERFRRLRNYGFINDYNVIEIGMNGKISEMNAALGCVSLSHVDEAIARRTELVEAYRAELADVPSVRFQAPAQAGATHTYKDLGVLFEDGKQRAAVEQALRDDAIETKRYFLPVHHMDAYKQWRDVDLPATEAVYDTVLCLPLFHELTDAERERVVATIKKAIG